MTRTRSEAAQPIGTTASGIDVVDRVVAILSAFRTGDAPLTLTEIANRTGLYKSTVLRLAASLVHHHFLTRMEDGRYQLGAFNHSLGQRYESNLDIADILMPLMRELNDRIGETIAFHVRDGDVRVCLFRVNSRFSVRAEIKPGDIQQLPRGAGGRILLAFDNAEGEPYDAIRQNLRYLSIGERDPETAGISAPVFGPSRQLIGAMGIVTPVTRMTASQIPLLTTALLETASRATGQLGGDTRPFDAALVRERSEAVPAR